MHLFVRIIAVMLIPALVVDNSLATLAPIRSPRNSDRNPFSTQAVTQALGYVGGNPLLPKSNAKLRNYGMIKSAAASSSQVLPDSWEPEGPVTVMPETSNLKWLLRIASVVSVSAGALIYGVAKARENHIQQGLRRDRENLKTLQLNGEFPETFQVKYVDKEGVETIETNSVRVADPWLDYAQVAEAWVATEFRNRKKLPPNEIDQLISRLEFGPGETLDTIQKAKPNRKFKRYVWNKLRNNPASLVAFQSDVLVGYIIISLVKAATIKDLPPKWELVTEQHPKDIDKKRDRETDDWFTGKDRETAEAMIDLSVLLELALEKHPEWGFEMLGIVSPISNPRNLADFILKNGPIDIIDYLLRVVGMAIDEKVPDGIYDIALSLHLRKGGAINGILENGHEVVGNGWVVTLDYIVRELENMPLIDGVRKNLVESKRFLLSVKEANQRALAAAV